MIIPPKWGVAFATDHIETYCEFLLNLAIGEMIDFGMLRAVVPSNARLPEWGGMMLVFVTTGAIAGILLGLYFKVLVLVPAILLATVIIIVNGSGDELSAIILTVVGTAVSLQIGYIVGCVLRTLVRAYVPSRTTDGAGRKSTH